jgi:hypothetical protein
MEISTSYDCGYLLLFPKFLLPSKRISCPEKHDPVIFDLVYGIQDTAC